MFYFIQIIKKWFKLKIYNLTTKYKNIGLYIITITIIKYLIFFSPIMICLIIL